MQEETLNLLTETIIDLEEHISALADLAAYLNKRCDPDAPEEGAYIYGITRIFEESLYNVLDKLQYFRCRAGLEQERGAASE